jgi:hypothetical protein
MQKRKTRKQRPGGFGPRSEVKLDPEIVLAVRSIRGCC